MSEIPYFRLPRRTFLLGALAASLSARQVAAQTYPSTSFELSSRRVPARRPTSSVAWWPMDLRPTKVGGSSWKIGRALCKPSQ